MEKHKKDSIIKCERCDYTVNNEKDMFEHNLHVHQITGGEQEEEDIRMEVDGHGSNAKAEDNDEVQILKERIKTLLAEHENKVNNLIKEHEDQMKLYETNKKRLEKEDLRKSNEINKLKEENAEILEKLGLMQWNKDKRDAELKAKEKMEKIKQNTKLFNEIIRKQESGQENRIVDDEMAMEVVESDEIEELQILNQNKQKGFSRTTPQGSPELLRRIENCEKLVIHCPQCDFATPSKALFNEHMTVIHTGPNCPFCFLPFKKTL